MRKKILMITKFRRLRRCYYLCYFIVKPQVHEEDFAEVRSNLNETIFIEMEYSSMVVKCLWLNLLVTTLISGIVFVMIFQLTKLYRS